MLAAEDGVVSGRVDELLAGEDGVVPGRVDGLLAVEDGVVSGKQEPLCKDLTAIISFRSSSNLMSYNDVILGKNATMMLLCHLVSIQLQCCNYFRDTYLDASYDPIGITKVVTRIIMCTTVAKSRGHRVGIIKQTTRARLAEMILPIRY